VWRKRGRKERGQARREWLDVSGEKADERFTKCRRGHLGVGLGVMEYFHGIDFVLTFSYD